MLPVILHAATPGSHHDSQGVHTKRHLYVVKKGDTLWSIASKHFKDPWKWRYIRKLNQKSIRNPHWIYPGQVIDLDKLGQEMYWANPGEEIVLEELMPALGLADGPDMPGDRSASFVVKKGDTLWGIAATHYKNHWKWHKVWKLNKNSIKNPHWIYPGQVFTLDEPLPLEITPKKAPVTVKPAAIQPAPIPLTQGKPVPAPAPVISAHVISIYNGTSQAGDHTVIIIDKGRLDGIENGHVLVLYSGDKANSGQIAASGTLDAGYGKAQVFRTFDKTSYATVTLESLPVKLLDIAIKQ